LIEPPPRYDSALVTKTASAKIGITSNHPEWNKKTFTAKENLRVLSLSIENITRIISILYHQKIGK
jgi:hypothetical protein